MSASLAAYALVIPEVSGGLYVSLQEGFEAAAQAQHHQILVCNSENSIYRQADQILQLMHKRVAGVAIVTATEATTPAHHIEMLQQMGIPVVLLHRAVPSVQAPSIILPLEKIGYEAGRAILAKGHQRVAIFPNSGGESLRGHLAGFSEALDEVELIPCSMPPFSGRTLTQMTPELAHDVRDMLEQMWARPADERPTALFVTSETVAELVYVSLMQMGLRVPEDISLMTFGGSYRGGAIAGRMSAVVVDETYAGQRAAALFGDIHAGQRPIRDSHSEVMSVSIFEGETLGVPSAALH
jgi:LacI family transcriptional regulator